MVWQALALLATNVADAPACWGTSPSPLWIFSDEKIVAKMLATHSSKYNPMQLKKRSQIRSKFYNNICVFLIVISFL
ncbi:hypothetical protein CUN59_20700 [Cuspidothrix issatschenkoi CHARLIE-1]|uniref:Uncharacterized protein n=1 Tax=Cuspidothrix issatschenkoi CHARLIE-1 TaxID=2052836 RepID=A0A2S6CP27_9CYAN|nr:hypothetical protein CUN59_20700 [Cuspidothrix issatschenkoi CHARLIE-1]